MTTQTGAIEGKQRRALNSTILDALALVDALDIELLTATGGSRPMRWLLVLVAGQDVEPPRDPTAPTAGGASPARPRRTGPSRYPARPQDPRTQAGRKPGPFKVEPDTGLMSMAKLTKASGSASSGPALGAELVSADPTIDQTPDVEVLGDSAYATGDMLHQLEAKKWKPLLKPRPINPVVEGGCTIDDYTYDPDTNT